MHELSISQAIADVVLRHAGDRQVASVQVRVGVLRQVVPDSLTFCWSIVSRRPVLDGSQLRIDRVPAVIDCPGCGVRSILTQVALCCPTCGNGLVAVVGGDDCMVTSIDLVSPVERVPPAVPPAGAEPEAAPDALPDPMIGDVAGEASVNAAASPIEE